MKSKIIITFSLLLFVFIMILVTTTVTSIVNQENDEITEENFEEMLSTIYKDVSTYVQIEHIYGKYCQTEHGRMITQIALQIKPFFSTEISLEKLIIEIVDQRDVHMRYYSGSASSIFPYSLFDHPEWINATSTDFSMISIFDLDSSITQYNLINEYSDRAYILLRLNDDQWINPSEHIEMNLLFDFGVNRYLNLQAPFSTKDVVQFY